MPPARFDLSSTPSDGPALRYYRGTAGTWSGRLRFAVTDWRGLSAARGARRLLVGPLSVLARFGAPERYEATGEVDEDATGAVYRVPWMGTDLVQRTRLVPDGLELTQETPWSHAAVLLVRTSPGAPGGAPHGSGFDSC